MTGEELIQYKEILSACKAMQTNFFVCCDLILCFHCKYFSLDNLKQTVKYKKC